MQAVVEQMHQIGALPVELTTALQIKSPSSIAGIYDSLGAQWNAPGQETLEGPVVLADPPFACPKKATKVTQLVFCVPCGFLHMSFALIYFLQWEGPPDGKPALANAMEIAGNIVLVQRGVCTFIDKIKLLHEHNAVGVIVMDDQEEDLLLMGGSSAGKRYIPSVMVKKDVGLSMKEAVEKGEEVFTSQSPLVSFPHSPRIHPLFTPQVWVRMVSGVEAMELKGSVGELGDNKTAAAVACLSVCLFLFFRTIDDTDGGRWGQEEESRVARLPGL